MIPVLVSLSALIGAASLVTLANATMTTILPLRMLADGASPSQVALFGAAYFLGFAIGCFSEPPRILRVGYIRAFAAAAALCTALAVVIDQTAGTWGWIALRFLMGLSIAAIFASVDGWINTTTPEAMRGRVFAIYGWCIGASAVAGQALLVVLDGLTVGFVSLLALAFNLAVILVALTRASAPSARPPADPDNPLRAGALTITSPTAIVGAIYAGLVTSAVLSILPALLAGGGMEDGEVALVIAAFFLGRLIWQIPVGMIADRMDLRLMIAIIAILTGGVALLGSVVVLAEGAGPPAVGLTGAGLLFLAIVATLGGLILPLYTVANSLAFARAARRPAVRIATTLLLVNAAGAVVGPLAVSATLPTFGPHALTVVVLATSTLTAGYALWRRASLAAHGRADTALSDIPATSLALTETLADTRAPEAAPPHLSAGA